MDYTTLIAAKTTAGSIKNWVNRSDIPSTVIVGEAQAWVIAEGKLRAREMVAQDELVFSLGDNTGALPTDLLEPMQFLPYGYGSPLDYVIPTSLYALRDDNGDLFPGTPVRWAIIGTEAQCDMAPETDFGGILTYYASPAALTTTNFITVRFPAMFRHALLAMAYSHMKQYSNSQAEMTMAIAAIDEINKIEENYLLGAQLW